MAIAFDTSNSAAVTDTSSTIAHTCTGDNLILFAAGYSDQAPTSVQYNGVDMTQIGTAATGVRLYYLINPATGNNNFVFTAGSSGAIWYATASYTGVKQSGVPDATNQTTSLPGTSTSLSVTTVADNCWTVAAILANNGSLSAGTGSSNVEANIDGSSRVGFFDSGSAITPAGSYSMGFNYASGSAGGIVMASFAPAVPQVVSVSDTVSLSESATESLDANINDTISLSEGLTISKIISLTVQDTISLAENFIGSLSAKISSTISASDTLSSIRLLWEKMTKNSTSWTDGTKNTTNWSKQSKN